MANLFTRSQAGQLDSRAFWREWHVVGLAGLIAFNLNRQQNEMTMQKTYLSTLGLLVCGLVLGITRSMAAAEEDIKYQPLSLSVEGGTLGLGGSLSWRFSDHVGIRGGMNYFTYSRNGDDIEGVAYNSKLRLMSEPIGLDIYPWSDRSFRVTVGALINQNRIRGNVPDPGVPGTTIVTIGANTYDVNQLQGLNLGIEQQSVSPYLSIGGNFYLDKAKHWSIGAELGVAYTGSPDSKISIGNPAIASNPGFIADRQSEESQINDKISDYKFYPIVKLSVSFSF